MANTGQASRRRGRPTLYNEAIAADICEMLAYGETLRGACRLLADKYGADAAPKPATVISWTLDAEKYPGFCERYAKAREIGYHAMADEILDIADDGTNDYVERRNKDGSSYLAVDKEHIARSRLRVDSRKWLLAKALPKVYGDKVSMEHSGQDGAPIDTNVNIKVQFVGTVSKVIP